MALNFPKCILKLQDIPALDSLLAAGGESGRERPLKESPGSL